MSNISIEISCPDLVKAAEIIASAIRGGATPVVERKQRVRFSKNDVTAMNAMILGGKGAKEIADAFGCDRTTVYNRKRNLMREVGA